MTLNEALKDIDIAFLQVEFAIKLLSYCELNKIDASEFDRDNIVLLQNGNLRFPTGNFSKPNSIIKAARVTVALAFGASALAMNNAFEVAQIESNPISDNNVVKLRTLVYMVRCAYAHGIADPRWKIGDKFKRTMNLDLPSGQLNRDLRELDGQPFHFEQLVGYRNWFLIKNATVKGLHEV